ncbi:MAG: hypothetical protein QM489_04360 [Candidatus Izemoplasma sp.]
MNNEKSKTSLVGLFTLVMIFILTRNFFLDFVDEYSYIGGFIKFFVLASIGDFISVKIKTSKWSVPNNAFLKAVVWGIIGVSIVFVFSIYPDVVLNLQESNILPFEGNVFFEALFISIIMNVTFAPLMMITHKISDTVLDNPKIGLKENFKSIDWFSFRKLILFKTIPLFWIPMHTITFLLPDTYRVIFAAVLGIFLGIILGLSKKVVR